MLNKQAEIAISTPSEEMSNILFVSGRLAYAFGYNPASCAWFDHAINGQ